MPTVKTFLLPDLGEGLTEADLLSWSVAVGDTVTLNQIVAEVETAKAMVELPSPYAGTVTALRAQEGGTLEVGAPLIDIEVAGSPPVPSERETRVPVLVGYGVDERPPRRRRAGTPAAAASPIVAVPPLNNRPLAAPPVRFVARTHDIALQDVAPTGIHGEITRSDLERHLQSRARTAGDAVPAAPDLADEVRTPIKADEVRTPIKGVRKLTAEAMVRSAFTAPHVTIFVDVDVTSTMELLEKLRATDLFAGLRLTPLAFVARALLIALRTNPALNSSWDEQAGEIVTKKYVNLGIAAATPRGLMVPNIKGAHSLSLRELALELTELTSLARAGKTTPADLAGGTITITNIGVFGIDSGTPIINPGEAAILCFGAIRKRPWEHQGELCLRSVTTLSLSFDHRLADGEEGAKFLAALTDLLADPMTMVALS